MEYRTLGKTGLKDFTYGIWRHSNPENRCRKEPEKLLHDND